MSSQQSKQDPDPAGEAALDPDEGTDPEQNIDVDAALVDALRKKVRTLDARIDEQDDRIDELERQVESGAGGVASTGGGRDQAVLDGLDAGEIVTVSGLKQRYRRHTDIRADRTLKSRVRSLTNRPEFEQVAHGTWRYTGGDVDVQ